MPFLLIWQGYGVAAPVDNVCLDGTIVVLDYPVATVEPISPIASLIRGVPLALLPIKDYPMALPSIKTYPIASLTRVEPTTSFPGVIEVLVYPTATIEVSPNDPIATLECIESA